MAIEMVDLPIKSMVIFHSYDTYNLVGGIPAPRKNMKVSWDDSSQYMESHSKFHGSSHVDCRTGQPPKPMRLGLNIIGYGRSNFFGGLFFIDSKTKFMGKYYGYNDYYFITMGFYSCGCCGYCSFLWDF